MPIGELVLYNPSYDKERKVLGIITKEFKDEGQDKYVVEWFEELMVDGLQHTTTSTEDTWTLSVLRNAYSKWMKHNTK